MLRLNNPCSGSKEAEKIPAGLPGEVCGLFPKVETLVRLLLDVSVLSSEAERSCSALRTVKT